MPVASVQLIGSRKQPLLTDQWSDIDLETVLHRHLKITMQPLEELTNHLGTVIGREMLVHKNEVVCRMALQIQQSIEMVDLKLISQHTVNHRAIRNAPQWEAWFKLFLATKKLMRKDNLMGMHLLMDVMRTILEIQMQQRDQIKGTNFHRFGADEAVQQILHLDDLQLTDTQSITHYLKLIAQTLDEQLAEHSTDYTLKSQYLAQYLNERVR